MIVWLSSWDGQLVLGLPVAGTIEASLLPCPTRGSPGRAFGSCATKVSIVNARALALCESYSRTGTHVLCAHLPG